MSPSPDASPRVAGWPSETLAASIGFGGTDGAAVTCLAALNRSVEDSAVDDLLRLDDYPVAMPLRMAWEFADTLNACGTFPDPTLMHRLWTAGVRCGVLVPVFYTGHENSSGTSSLMSDADVADYVEDWRARGYTVTHAVWHIANGDPDPAVLGEHPATTCTPEAFATMWALAGRTAGTDPVLESTLHWMRAVHVD